VIEHLTTAGTFSLDGQDFAVENNVWFVGDDREVVVIDAPHEADSILAAVGDRRIVAVVATHGHNDHINAAAAVADAAGAPIYLHAADLVLWHQVYPDRMPDGALTDGMVIEAGSAMLEVVHTPGHTPGGCCLRLAEDDAVFSGDTLFRGGPGATGRSFSDFPTIIDSIRNRLFVLPDHTRVFTGHGEGTSIGDERPHLDEWIARGH